MLERLDTTPASLTPADFARNFAAPARPVILRGLFAGQPIAEITTREAAIAALGHVELHRVDQHSEQFRSAVRDFLDGRPLDRGPFDRPVEKTESIAAYLSRDARDARDARDTSESAESRDWPDSSDENGSSVRPLSPSRRAHARARAMYQLHGPSGPTLKLLYKVPAFCDSRLYPGCRGIEEPRSLEPNRLELAFVGRRGSYADLHNHRDLYHIFLHHLFGRKKVVLFPPEAAGKLAPAMYMSTIALHKLSAEELTHFVAYAGGVVDELAPGETLFLPATWWHYFEYVDDAMSINMRFAEPADEDLQFLIYSSPDYRLKRIAFELRDPARLEKHRADIAHLRWIAGSPRLSAQQRYRDFIVAAASLYRRLLPNESRSHVDWNDDALGNMIGLSSLELGGWRRRTMNVLRRVGYRITTLA